MNHLQQKLLLLAVMLAGCQTADNATPEPGPDGKIPDAPGVKPPEVPEACDVELNHFRDQVWRPTLSVQCLGCHNSEGPAGQTRMVLVAGEDDDALKANFQAVGGMAALELGGESLLLLRPTLRHPEGHTGGDLLDEESEAYFQLTAFADYAPTEGCDYEAPAPINCDTVAPGARVVRRLTPAEYDASVKSLLGHDSTAGVGFAADPVVHGFDNQAEALRVSALLADQLRVAAEDHAATYIAQGRAALCGGDNDAACSERLVADIGARAFRRPLTDREQQRYLGLYAVAAGDGLEAGISLVLQGMLQSPNFLYRQELGEHQGGGIYKLSDHEIATQISFLLTGTSPDNELRAAADRGELQTVEEIRAHTERLLGTPQARTTLNRFFFSWLDVERINSVPKDTALYAEFDAETRASMREETERFIDQVWHESEGSFTDLLLADYSFANSTLATFYGEAVPAELDAQGWGRISNNYRKGLLTQGSLLSVHARSNSSSPVHRGTLVREKFFCQELPPPPPGVNAEPPPLDPSLTTRDRYAAHSELEPCRSCHVLIDPIGLGFEHFDGVGRHRSDDNGQTIDVSGEIVQTEESDATFEGLGELASLLAASPDVHRCFSSQWYRYAYGQEPNRATACLLEQVQGDFRNADLSLDALIIALVSSPHVRTRHDEAIDVGPDPDPDPDPDPTPDPDPVPGDLSVNEIEDSSWDSGYCHTVEVTNNGSAEVRWAIELSVQGTMTQLWNAESDGDQGTVRFAGVNWNADLQPGATASFGFCAER